MSIDLLGFFKEQEIEYAEQFDVSAISYIRIGGKASYAAMPNSTEKLIKLVKFLNSHQIAYKIVGGMSNILPSDSYYPGVLIITTKCNRYYVAENTITLECGVRLSKVIRALAALGVCGMESLSGIPGTVGGAVRSNAGAYGCSVSDFIVSATLYSPKEKKKITFAVGDMGMSYRKSRLIGSDLVLLSADFTFSRDDSESIFARIKSITEKRHASQPYNMPSLGSVFKRKDGIPMSLLIDRLGLKGLSVGGAQVSEKHAGFIVNTGGATAKDVLTLISILKERIYAECGILPEEEIEIF